MPHTKSVIKGKSTVQDNTLSCYELGRVEDFREKIAGLFLPQDLLKDVFQSSSIWQRGFRLKTSKDFVCFSAMPLFLCHVFLTVPTPTSRLLSGTASVEQAALSSLYVLFMCCFAWFVC